MGPFATHVVHDRDAGSRSRGGPNAAHSCARATGDMETRWRPVRVRGSAGDARNEAFSSSITSSRSRRAARQPSRISSCVAERTITTNPSSGSAEDRGVCASAARIEVERNSVRTELRRCAVFRMDVPTACLTSASSRGRGRHALGENRAARLKRDVSGNLSEPPLSATFPLACRAPPVRGQD
jgi:hypothetical protein